MQVARGQDAGAVRRDAPEVCDSRFVDLLERLEDGCDEQVATRVRFDLRLVELRVRPARMPRSFGVGEAECVSEPVRLPDCLAELQRHCSELVSLLEIPSNRPDLRAEDVALREMLEQRDQVGEPFVQGGDVRVCADVELDVHAHQDGMGDLVRDDVLREAAEDGRAGKLRVRAALEVAEVDAALGRVVRVRFLHEVRIERELLAVGRFLGVPFRWPVHDPAERSFEVLDRAHRDRIDHLLAELRARRRKEAARPPRAPRESRGRRAETASCRSRSRRR